jgi:hypothetical protein
MIIEDIFSRYRVITLNVIDLLEKNHDGNVDILMNEREELIKEIGLLDSSKEEKRRVYDSFDLVALDKKLEETIKKNMYAVKSEIKKNANRRKAHLTYASNMRQENLFAKKV